MNYVTDPGSMTWNAKYRWKGESRVMDTWERIAGSLAENAAEKKSFLSILEDHAFLPGGRIQAGAGTGRNVTLFNCFVMGEIEDSLSGIFDALKEGALTMQQGGGVGYDFSPLRPAGSAAKTAGLVASGPVSFMKIWDSMCATILSTGARRGAMMGTLRCDHPDILDFVNAKRSGDSLRNFNLSVLASDSFMEALRENGRVSLVFPEGGKTVSEIGARDLWKSIMESAYACAEPGVLFIDRIREADNLGYCERVSATNPCGEIPLPPYGACDLGSINLARFVESPFTNNASLDLEGIARTAKIAVRMLDRVYDVSRFPLEKQRKVALSSRRIGLGITGLADCLAMLGIRYSGQEGRNQAGEIMQTIKECAYSESVEIARKKGPFPLFSPAYLERQFISSLPSGIRKRIARHGIRNSHLLAIAPTGTISLLAGNVSSGLEPIHALEYERNIRLPDGRTQAVQVSDHAFSLFRRTFGNAPLPECFETGIEPLEQLLMQAALQHHVDNAISKTVSVPQHMDFESFSGIYSKAYELGLKGCTAYRPNPVTGTVLGA